MLGGRVWVSGSVRWRDESADVALIGTYMPAITGELVLGGQR
jgi:hypothetical protein